MFRVPIGSFDFAVYYDCQEEIPIDERFYDCREPPELRHLISDTGDINPTMRTTPCSHMWRTMKTMRVPLMQSNRYANWVRCPACGHTHATITYSATWKGITKLWIDINMRGMYKCFLNQDNHQLMQ